MRNWLIGAGPALFVGVCLLVAGFLVGGRYSASPAPGGVYVTDRFSGDVRVCMTSQCLRLPGG